MHRWTEEELAILREMYPTHFSDELSEILGIGEGSIRGKARSLGLRKAEGFNVHARYGRFTGKGGYKP